MDRARVKEWGNYGGVTSRLVSEKETMSPLLEKDKIKPSWGLNGEVEEDSARNHHILLSDLKNDFQESLMVLLNTSIERREPKRTPTKPSNFTFEHIIYTSYT